MEAKEIQSEMSDAFNTQWRKFNTEFADALIKDHPTLQQHFWRFVQDVAEHYEQHGLTDGRNQASKDFVRHLNEMVGKQSLDLPFI